MKNTLLSLFLSCLSVIACGQNFTLPANPNAIDAKGLRQGKWTILFDKDWKVVAETSQMEFFRVIAYKNDKPVGIVKDHYKNGVVQMEATFLQDRPEEIMDGLAIFYDAAGKKEKEALYKNGKVESEKLFFDENSWKGLDDKAKRLYSEGKIKEAQEVFVKARIQAEKEFGKNHPNYAESCNMVGFSYYIQRLFAEGLPFYKESKDIMEKVWGKEHPAYINACNSVAILYEKQGLYVQAAPFFLEVKNIKEKMLGRDNLDFTTSYNDLALLYHKQGLYGKTLPMYIDIKNIREKIAGKAHPEYAKACHNLSALYQEQGLYTKALPLMIEAKDVWQKAFTKEHSDYANACHNLATLYVAQGFYAEALPLMIEAKDIREKVWNKNHEDYGISCSALASLYMIQGLYKEALPLIIEAKNIRVKQFSTKHPDYAKSCYQLAHLYTQQAQYKEALPLLIEAKDIQAAIFGKEHLDYATSCSLLASLYEKQGLYAEALPLYIETKNIIEKAVGKAHTRYAMACNQLANLYNNQNKQAEAEALYIESNQAYLAQINTNFSNLSEKEKEIYYNTFSHSFEKFNAFALTRCVQNPAIMVEVYNNTLATKALLFNASNKMRARILGSKDSSLIKLYQSWQDKKEFLAKIYTLSANAREKQGIDLPALEIETNKIEKQLASQSELFAQVQDKKQYVWTDVQKSLKKKEAAIEIIRCNLSDKKLTDSTQYVALIITPTSQYPELIVLENGNDLEEKHLKNYKNCIKTKNKDKNSYTQYWAKIAGKLQGTTKVYVSIDGVYNAINLNTLKNPTTGKYLNEEITIQVVSNTKDLAIAKVAGKAIKKVTLIGFPDYNNKNTKPSKEEERAVAIKLDSTQRFFDGNNITELEGTKVEVENLAHILQSQDITIQKLLGKEATESNLKTLSSPEVLHIATHGFFLKNVTQNSSQELTMLGIDSRKVIENPLLRSGLLLANAKEALTEGGDGVLTAYEAMNLNLDNTELVVMSACETGLGEISNGEGVYGLQRAFQIAGAKTILMSLWTVNDEATQELMTLFYQNWILKKQTKRLAFQNAQKQLKKKYPEPYYWGAFVMVGE